MLSSQEGYSSDIGRGDLLTNKVVSSGKYIFAILNGNDNEFKKKGSNRLFVGTINQIVKRLEIINASEKSLIYISIPNKFAHIRKPENFNSKYGV